MMRRSRSGSSAGRRSCSFVFGVEPRRPRRGSRAGSPGWRPRASWCWASSARSVSRRRRGALRRMFVQDGLAIFAKRLFLVGDLHRPAGRLVAPARAACGRRAGEYHLLILASLLGMLVLASARDLILLFVAFELMSIPLYVLAGLPQARGRGGRRRRLKFFLVGSVSSARDGLRAVVRLRRRRARPTSAAIAQAVAPGHLLVLLLGLLAGVRAASAFKIAAFPFHMWVPDTYEAASTPFVAWLSVAPKAAGFVAIFRRLLRGRGRPRGHLDADRRGPRGDHDRRRQPDGAAPAEHRSACSRTPGIAHIGYMLVGLRGGVRRRRRRWCSSIWSPTSSGTWAPSSVVEAVARVGGLGEHPRRCRGLRPALAAARPRDAAVPALARGHPVRGGLLGEALRLLGGRGRRACTGWCSSARSSTVVALFYYLLVAKRM